MSCVEKQALVASYQHATEDFAQAVEGLNDLRATASRAQYETLRLDSEAARLTSERARLALEQHVTDHGC